MYETLCGPSLGVVSGDVGNPIMHSTVLHYGQTLCVTSVMIDHSVSQPQPEPCLIATYIFQTTEVLKPALKTVLSERDQHYTHRSGCSPEYSITDPCPGKGFPPYL